jgi:ribose transport system substrate-binding protein
MSINRSLAMAILVACAALAIAACGEDAESSDESGGSADLTAAREAIQPYVGKPSPFPVTEPLEEVPTGAKIKYVDPGTPVGALFWELLQPAAQTMGVELSRVKGGQTAESVNAAFDAILSQKPDGVIVGSIDLRLWQSHLRELQDAGVPVVTSGVVDAADHGVEAPQYARQQSERDGALLADYIVATYGDGAEISLYKVPELTFTAVVADAFTAEVEDLCPDCSVRTVDIAAATLGNTAPNQIVSDLQANPDTTVAVFTVDEIQTGLPAARKAAGIDIEAVGMAPAPANLEYIKDGDERAGLAIDIPVLTWTLLDQMARQIIGQELAGDQAKGITVIQFLAKDDLDFDPSQGWTGYPDFAERFAKLWGANG